MKFISTTSFSSIEEAKIFNELLENTIAQKLSIYQRANCQMLYRSESSIAKCDKNVRSLLVTLEYHN